MWPYYDLFTDTYVLCSHLLSQVDPQYHQLGARIPGQKLTDSEDAECSPVVGPDREERSCVEIEEVGIQPKLRPDVPSQRITEFIDSGGGKVHQGYPGDDLEATVCQYKRISLCSLTFEKGE